MRLRRLVAACLFALATAGSSASPQEGWSRFRGPNGTGVSPATGLPAELGPETNVVWKTALPPGHSSPVLSEDRIFLTGHRGDSLLTLAIDRGDGRVLWEREGPRNRTTRIDARNSPASPSPVTDGEHVYVFFPDYGLLAYGVDGTERWRLPLGPFNNVYGMGASPVLVDDLVVLVCDHNIGSYILAVDRHTGRQRWRTERPEARSGHSTPVVWRPPSGAAQIIVPGSFFLTAYEAATGAKLWWVGGLSFESKSVPVIQGDTVYTNGFGAPENNPGAHVAVASVDEAFRGDADGDDRLSREELTDKRAIAYFDFIDLGSDGRLDRSEWEYFIALSASENGLLAVRLGGHGDVTRTNVRWKYHRAVPQLPSPLIYEGVLYMLNDQGGIVTALDPATGQLVEQGRLKGAIDAYFASPVAADGKIYMVSHTGKVVVLRPGGSLEPVVVNDLQEDAYATPALGDGRIYLRTVSTLYAFGLPDTAASTP